MATDKQDTVDEQKLLAKIKRDVKMAGDAFKENYERFNFWIRYMNYSTVTEDDAAKLRKLQKPLIGANIISSINERAIYEFSENPPSIMVSRNETQIPGAQGGATDDQIEFLESFLREILTNPQCADFAVPAFTDSTEGGFSSVYVGTRYANSKAWHQDIYIEKAYNPCMVFYDPYAKEPHKGDGEYCGEIMFLTEEEYLQEYGEEVPKAAKARYKYTSDGQTILPAGEAFAGYQWVQQVDGKKLIAVAKYYYKEHVRERQFLMSNGKTVNLAGKDKMMQDYAEDLYTLEAAPDVLKEEMRDVVKIKCVHACENKILREEDTPFIYLPWVFVDGNSKLIANGSSGGYKQVTFPRMYHALGSQKLLDFCMQTAGNEIENMVMTKFKMPIESLPDDERYIKAYTSPQQASLYVYKSQNDKMPEKPLAGPQEVQRTPTPPIVMDTWQMCLQLLQQTGGTYDMQQQLDARTSGSAILQGNLGKGQAGETYHRNFRVALTRIAEIVVSLMPIYYDTPRQLPIRNMDNDRIYKSVNDKSNPDSVMLDFTPEALKIVIEAGPSVSAQRQMAIQQLTAGVEVLPKFGQFFQDECGDIFINQLDLKEKNMIKERWKKWNEQNEQQAQEMAEMQQQLDMAMKQAQIASEQSTANKNNAQAQAEMQSKVKEMVEMFMKEAQQQKDNQYEEARIALEAESVKTEALSKKYAILQRDMETMIRAREVAAENARTAVDSVLKASEHEHNKIMDVATLQHEMNMAHKEHRLAQQESNQGA